MNFLVADPYYPEREELCQDFAADLERQVRDEFGDGARVEDVDAGPSASIPAYFLELAGPVADALAILGAPIVLREGLAVWKTWFERAVAFLHRLGLVYAVDVRTATILAVDAVFKSTGSTEGIEVISATRHWVNLGGPGSEHMSGDALGSRGEAMDKHFTAVTQLAAHYVLLVLQGVRCFTVLVRRDGTIIHVEELGIR